MPTFSRALFALALTCVPGAAVAQQALPPASESMRIHVDPVTGQRLAGPPLIPPPMDGPTVELPQAAKPRPALREIKGTSRAGGVLVDLQGQFDQSIEASVREQGELHVGCKHHEASTAGVP